MTTRELLQVSSPELVDAIDALLLEMPQEEEQTMLLQDYPRRAVVALHRRGLLPPREVSGYHAITQSGMARLLREEHAALLRDYYPVALRVVAFFYLDVFNDDYKNMWTREDIPKAELDKLQANWEEIKAKRPAIPRTPMASARDYFENELTALQRLDDSIAMLDRSKQGVQKTPGAVSARGRGVSVDDPAMQIHVGTYATCLARRFHFVAMLPQGTGRESLALRRKLMDDTVRSYQSLLFAGLVPTKDWTRLERKYLVGGVVRAHGVLMGKRAASWGVDRLLETTEVIMRTGAYASFDYRHFLLRNDHSSDGSLVWVRDYVRAVCAASEMTRDQAISPAAFSAFQDKWEQRREVMQYENVRAGEIRFPHDYPLLHGLLLFYHVHCNKPFVTSLHDLPPFVDTIGEVLVALDFKASYDAGDPLRAADDVRIDILNVGTLHLCCTHALSGTVVRAVERQPEAVDDQLLLELPNGSGPLHLLFWSDALRSAVAFGISPFSVNYKCLVALLERPTANPRARDQCGMDALRVLMRQIVQFAAPLVTLRFLAVDLDECFDYALACVRVMRNAGADVLQPFDLRQQRAEELPLPAWPQHVAKHLLSQQANILSVEEEEKEEEAVEFIVLPEGALLESAERLYRTQLERQQAELGTHNYPTFIDHVILSFEQVLKTRIQTMGSEDANAVKVNQAISTLIEGLRGIRDTAISIRMVARWMGPAVHRSKVGVYGGHCKAEGFTGVTEACIDRDLNGSSKIWQKRAQFARAARNISARHHGRQVHHHHVKM